MAQKKQVFKETLKKKGYWDYKELYHFSFDYLKKENYEMMEKAYTEKQTDFGKEIELEWVTYRKVTDYFKFVIKLDWHILGMNPAEIERDGKKEKTNKGEVKITIRGELEKDYENRWEDKPFNKFLRGVYEKYIIRATITEYEDDLTDECVKLVSQIKAFLEL